MKNIFNKIIKLKDKLPVILFLIKYRFIKNKKSNKVKLFNYDIKIQDFLSFYYEVVYIFKDEIYHFNASNKTPLIIDGGVCIGTSLLYFKKIYPHSKIIGFEPDKVAFEIAQENIKVNKLEDIRLVKSGLSDINGKVSFSKMNIDSGKIEDSGSDEIEVRKLSDYVTEKVDFLKLNIEGSEGRVLKELDHSGKMHHIKEMCIEWHSFRGENQDLDEVLSILKKNDFKYIISSLSTAAHGRFMVDSETEYFLILYAKRKN